MTNSINLNVLRWIHCIYMHKEQNKRFWVEKKFKRFFLNFTCKILPVHFTFKISLSEKFDVGFIIILNSTVANKSKKKSFWITILNIKSTNVRKECYNFLKILKYVWFQSFQFLEKIVCGNIAKMTNSHKDFKNVFMK